MMLRKILMSAAMFFVTIASAQISAETALQTLDDQYPQEKIYLLTDKSSYTAGDHLWFKAFVMSGLTTSEISTSLMVELYSREKKLIVRRTVPIFDGEASGDFPVSDTLRENVYYLRAYTPWMTNFSEDFQMVKKLPVYNPDSKEKLVKVTESPWSISAHPEGGTLLADTPVKVAVRMHTEGIFPEGWEGFLAEASQPETPLVRFTAMDRNIGLFTFTPETGKKYTITVTDRSGKKSTTTLPAATTEGLHLAVNSMDDKIEFHLKTPKGATAVPYKVVASMGSRLVYKALFKSFSGEATYAIPTDQLLNGVLQITVFDAHEKVVARRLCFVMPGKLSVLKPDISHAEISTQPRANSSFEITSPKEIPAYTVRVTDAASKNFDENENLLTALWLTQDFNAPIDDAASYFSGKGNMEALDALLISEEWKRFDWNSVLAGEFPRITTKNNAYLSYTGKLTINGKPSPYTTLNLLVSSQSDKNVKIVQASTDANGEFMLNNMVFNEPLTIRYQVNGLSSALNETALVYVKPSVSYIPLKKDFPAETGYRLEPRTAGEALLPQVARSLDERKFKKAYDDKVTTIQEVQITAKKKNATEELNKELSSPMFSSMDEKVFDFVNDNQSIGGYTDILQWLQGRVAGLQIQNQNGESVPYIRNSKATIYLDEMQMDASSIRSISVSDIAMVKVIKGPLAGAIGGGGGGSVLIYTKRGDHSQKDHNNEMSSSLQSFVLGGYSKVQPYDSPDYSNADLKKMSVDSRSVLYWNPHLEQDIQKPELVDFYNNDKASGFNVLIIGFDKEHMQPLMYQGTLK